MEQNCSESRRYDLPGARKFLPSNREDVKSYPGVVIDAIVPNVERQPIFCLSHDATLLFGKREPVDFAVGMQASAEVKMILNYWDIDRLEGRIIICPTEECNHEFLHRLIETAYRIEGAMSEVKQRWSTISGFVKAVWGAL